MALRISSPSLSAPDGNLLLPVDFRNEVEHARTQPEKASPNTTKDTSSTDKKLLDAARSGDVSRLSNVLRQGEADLNAVDVDGNNVLQLFLAAVGSKHTITSTELIKRLLQSGTRLEHLNAEGESLLDTLEASVAGAPEGSASQQLVASLKSLMREQLHDSVRAGTEAQSVALIEAGADPYADVDTAYDPEGVLSDLHFAATSGQKDTVKAILASFSNLSKSERLARVNEQGLGGDTALHGAKIAGDDEMVQLLEDAGARDDIANDEGITAAQVPPEHQKRFIGALIVGTVAFALAYQAWHLGSSGPAAPVEAPPPPAKEAGEAEDLAREILTELGRNEQPVWKSEAAQATYDEPRYALDLGPIRLFAGISSRGMTPLARNQLYYITNRLEDLLTIAKTDIGKKLLNELFSSGKRVGITSPRNKCSDDQAGFAENAGTFVERDDITIHTRGISQGKNNPADVVLFHELVHARHMQGYETGGDWETAHSQTIEVNGLQVFAEEARTTGLGPWAQAEMTENAYRDEVGLSRRKFYGSENEIADNGLWGGKPDGPNWWDAVAARHAEPEDARSFLSRLVRTLADNSDIEAGTITPLSDPALRDEFKKMLSYHLGSQEELEGLEAGSRRYLVKALDQALEDIKEKLGAAFDDKATGRRAQELFQSYIGTDGRSDFRPLADEVFEDYLEASDLTEVPLNTDVSTFLGYKSVTTTDEYNALLSGDEGTQTFFSYDHEFTDIIRFHQERDGGIINQGVIDKDASPEAAARAMYERDFMDQIKDGKIDFQSLLHLRFGEGSGRPEWSPALIRSVDDWLKNAQPSSEEMEEVRISILTGAMGRGWSHAELQAILDSGVADGNHLSPLLSSIKARFYDHEHVPSKQEFENALNALAVYIGSHMTKSEGPLPDFDDEARGYLEAIVKYHFLNFKAVGADRTQRTVAVRYHFGADYLFADLPGIIADRVSNVPGLGVSDEDARFIVREWLNDDRAQAQNVMAEVIFEQSGKYAAWAEWLFSNQLRLIDW